MKIKMLYLEDDPEIRQGHVDDLTRRGFEVYGAASTEEADLILEQVDYLDVALLDMNLGPDSKTGAEYIMTLREQKFSGNPPECLIFSGEDHYRYYQQAIRLGATGYIRKADNPFKRLDVPLRALALRKNLRWERQPHVLRMLRDIAARAGHRDEAMAMFSQDVLRPQLGRILTNPFLLMVTTLKGSQCFTNQGQALEHHALDDFVAGLPCNSIKDMSELNLPIPDAWGETNGASFINLYSSKGFRLDLGIVDVPRFNRQFRYANEAHAMAEALWEYVKPIFFSSLENLITIMTEHDDAYLGGITSRCDWLVQKLTEVQTALLDPVGFQRAYEGVSDLLREVRHQGEAGASILAAGQPQEDDYQDWTDEDPYSNYVEGAIKEEPPTINRDVRDDVQTLVNEVCRQVMGTSAYVSWQGPTSLPPADRSIVWEFCSQIFHWMKHRVKAESPVVSVFCNFEGDRQVLVLEDTSSRAPEDERADLFHYSSRFPSHTLFFLYQRVKRLGGYVEDKTDEKEGGQGHRFQLCLPVSSLSVA